MIVVLGVVVVVVKEACGVELVVIGVGVGIRVG